jgi:hypothetical protein
MRALDTEGIVEQVEGGKDNDYESCSEDEEEEEEEKHVSWCG